ncbi:putative mrna cleavage factor complex component pcf11 protein [Eutypa lata UCREL1]|uniref:Putative mrna cleavage factor complex component pcf11 protein n=1 Tax=Eutypa lata (strain UCR-EL1) TaxID=1287681 RepID=M7TIE9_EUTLA|nr:putative mrna cleavage factor complex component pcf11 protein [Eutypa lata UCREL1]
MAPHTDIQARHRHRIFPTMANHPQDQHRSPLSHQLPSNLLNWEGTQCSQCGRRFTTDVAGKKKKTAHMDWHFKVNRRITEAEKRGQHRSWLVDKMDWIKSRETIDEDHVGHGGDGEASSGMGGAAAALKKAPKLQYIPVPDDPILANSVCPICQEKFETRWLDDAQEFVWPDAIKVGQRVYHASCHREAARDEPQPPARYARSTPEPVLGKRKAEQDELSSLRGKLKMEAA